MNYLRRTYQTATAFLFLLFVSAAPAFASGDYFKFGVEGTLEQILNWFWSSPGVALFSILLIVSLVTAAVQQRQGNSYGKPIGVFFVVIIVWAVPLIMGQLTTSGALL